MENIIYIDVEFERLNFYAAFNPNEFAFEGVFMHSGARNGTPIYKRIDHILTDEATDAIRDRRRVQLAQALQDEVDMKEQGLYNYWS